MSAVRFQNPSYKLFESEYHPEKRLVFNGSGQSEASNTISLKFEEISRALNRGDPSGDSPPRNGDMTTYTKASLPSMQGYDQPRYQDSGFEQYPQAFSTQSTDKYAQLNQQNFASNNAVAHFMPTGPTVLSCQPLSGIFGTKVFLRISFHYDVFSMTPMPYLFLSFGSEKCPLQDVVRDNQDNTGFVYSCSADVPQLLVTGGSSNNVPLSLVVEGPSGEEISRAVAGSFQYLEGSEDDITRASKLTKHDSSAPGPQLDHPSASPKIVETQITQDGNTNTYDYPGQHSQYTNTFPQANDMITTYRSSSFAEPHYSQRRSIPGWHGFGSSLNGVGRGPGGLENLHGRPNLTPLPMPSSSTTSASGTPQLIRTSTIAGGSTGSGSYHPISLYSTKAVLKINGKLDTMAEKWTQEEWDNRRRIVMFRKSQTGSTLSASFRAVSVNERPTNSICVSCIWWAEKGECFVTSVDTISLLEQLVAAPNRFSVEEKNRIRRNLEGFHPLTVSKAKAESEEFFKLIMGFPNPKPRNIEKDVKVFPWKILEPALKKIIGKYSASPSSTLPPANMVASSTNAPYAPLPTPPGQGLTSQSSIGSHHGDVHSQYSVSSSHHDPIPSPRSLSSSQQSWAPYSTASYPSAVARTLSPNIRTTSPHQPPSMRIMTNTLPAVTGYDSRSASAGNYGSNGLHTPINHHPSTSTPPRWDAAPNGYSDNYSSIPASHPHPHQPMYSANTYSDGTQRS